jgi:hypothetical protein
MLRRRLARERPPAAPPWRQPRPPRSQPGAVQHTRHEWRCCAPCRPYRIVPPSRNEIQEESSGCTVVGDPAEGARRLHAWPPSIRPPPWRFQEREMRMACWTGEGSSLVGACHPGGSVGGSCAVACRSRAGTRSAFSQSSWLRLRHVGQGAFRETNDAGWTPRPHPRPAHMWSHGMTRRPR